MGGDPDIIEATPDGNWGKYHERGEERVAFTGKVAGLVYDRFGDFEGFLLDTEDGERRFQSTERQVEELIHAAWIQRIATTVWAERHDQHHPVSIILGGVPPRYRQWYSEKE